MATSTRDIHIGICGAGIGGVLAAIAIADAGAKVTVLEAAAQLGEVHTLASPPYTPTC